MSKTLIISALLTLFSLTVMRVVPYFEGYAFDKYWSVPMGVLPFGLLSFIVFVVTSVVVVIKIFRKQQSKYNLVVVGGLFLFAVVSHQIPIPHYVDGMKKRILTELTQKELFDFVLAAQAEDIDWLDREMHLKLIEDLRSKHNKALSLSTISPRVEKGEGYVSVFYGGALVKHWGYVAGDIDEFPIKHIPKDMQRKVYEGVWVYHDIW